LSCNTFRHAACSRALTVTLDRRRLLRGSVAGALALSLPGCGGGGASVPNGPIAAGNVADVALNTLNPVPDGNVLIGRDAMDLYAMSAVCTHAGCVVSTFTTAAAGVVCNCHGSRFNANGAVTQGPAGSPLVHFRVDVAADGSITIQGGIQVSAATRA
jgi:Rieske Fe-S protein